MKPNRSLNFFDRMNLSLATVAFGSVISQSAWCAEISKVNARDISRLEAVLKALKVESDSIPRVADATKSSLPRRFNSSIYLKSMFEDYLRWEGQILTFSQGVVIDPSKDVRTRYAEKAAEDMWKVIDYVEKNFIPSRVEQGNDIDFSSGVAIFLEQFHSQVFVPHTDELQRFTANALVEGSRSLLKADNALTPFLEKLGKNKDRKTVEMALGSLKGLEWRNGNLAKAIFVPPNQKLKPGQTPQVVELSLPMLLTFRTNQDDAFLTLLRSLNRYFAMQYSIFTVKRNLLNGSRFVLVNANVNNWRRFFPELFNLTPLESPANKTGTALNEHYQKMYAQFSEKVPTAQESKFITKRLDRLLEIMPYLQERLAGAELANRLLKQLTEKQLHGLLAWFLIHNSSDLYSSKEYRLKEAQLNKETDLLEARMMNSSPVNVKGLKVMEEQLAQARREKIYLRILNFQLQDLRQMIKAEDSIEAAHDEEILQISR